MKTSNLIIVCIYIYLVIVSALELKVKKQKKPFIIHYQRAFDFFQNSSVLFHQVIFDHSISCVLLIDEPNESYKNSKTFQRNTLFKKKAFKNKIKYYTSKDKCPNFTNFFRMPKINNSNLSNEKQKELKMKLGQLQEEISKASLPVSADLSNDFKSIILETDQRKISPFMRLFWEEQQKYL